MSDVTYIAQLDNHQVLNQLIEVNTALKKTETIGDKAFSRINKKSKLSRMATGFVAGAVSALTTELIQMGKSAAKAFLTIIQGGVELNTQLESTRISLVAIFEGNEGAADAFLASMKEMSIKLRVPFTELAFLGKGILPDVGSVANTQKMLEQFTILGRDAGQNFTSIRIALEEALSGNLYSLQRRLNIPAFVIDKIREMSEEMGYTEAIIQALGDRIIETGLDLENFTDSGLFAFGAVQAEARELQRLLTNAGFEELKDQAQEFLKVFYENKDDVEYVTKAVGDLIADIVEFLGQKSINFLENLDPDKIDDVVLSAKNLLDTINIIYELLNVSKEPKGFLWFTNEQLNQAKTTLLQLIALGKAFTAGNQAAAEVLAPDAKLNQFGFFGEVGKFARDKTSGFFNVGFKLGRGEDDPKVIAAKIAAEKAFNEVMKESVKLLDGYDNALEENKKELEEATEVIEKSTTAELALGEAILSRRNLLGEMVDLEKDMAEVRKDIVEDLAKANLSYERELADAQKDFERDKVDAVKDSVSDREDLEQKHLKKLRDLQEDYEQDILKANRKYQYNLEEIDIDAAQKRIDIENSYQEKLRQIQASFQASAEEAERVQDAIGYLRAVRDRDRAIANAKDSREEDYLEAERDREEDVRKAKRTLDDKLADLKHALEYDQQEREIAYQYELEQQAKKEEEKRQDLLESYRQELEDLAEKNRRRKEDLTTALSEELQLYRDYIKELIEMKKQIVIFEAEIAAGKAKQQIMGFQDLMSRAFGSNETDNASSNNPYDTYLPNDTYLPIIMKGIEARESGGPVSAGIPYIVGERGKELFVPETDGRILPNSMFHRPNAISPSSGSSNSTSISNTFNLAEAMLDDPVSRSKIQRLINNEIQKVLV